MPDAVDDTLVGPKTLAFMLDMGAVRIRQLVDEGILTKESRGQYPLAASVRAYVRWLRDESRRAAQSAANSRFQDAKAAQIEQKIAREARKLIYLQEALETVDAICGLFRSELDGLPARATRDKALREVLEKVVFDILTRISDEMEKQAEKMTFGPAGKD